ncbi:MAG: dynamin family protein [Hyphomicrobiales bacterium]
MAGLVECGQAIRPIVSRRMRSSIDDTLTHLQHTTFTIAVIGQTKAGKSSLINAMVKRPGLLPTDANPWTSVVTRLHFEDREERSHGMIFHFFSEKEWHELVEGGGRQAAMIERVAPESGREGLLKQVALIRQRAEKRLGPAFRHLLGKQHRFSNVSDAVLERYVSSGEFVTDVSDHHAPGRYADITKLAELYFDLGPFACSTVVIDTPGINDPLLIRDEMTHRHLANADICVVVLNAQQALSTADMDLLRLLHGQHRGRIVIFVNRIDLLGDVVDDCAKVASSVRSRLEQEFPTANIPVVWGSARWGEYAQQVRGSDIVPLATRALIEFAQRLNIASEGDFRSWLRTERPDIARFQAVLRHCSGMPALRAAIADLLAAGPGRHAIERAQAALNGLIRSAEAANANELSVLTALGEAVTGNSRTVLRQLSDIERNFRGLTSLEQQLSDAGAAFEQDIILMKDVGLQCMGAQLEGLTERFADAQGAMLDAAASVKPAPRMWRCDVNPLRRRLARQFLDDYRHLISQLLELQENAVDQVRALLAAAAPGHSLEIGYQPPHLIDPSPSIAALGQMIALDLGRPWFEWWKRWYRSTEKVQTLKRLIRSELQPVIAELIATARAEVDPHAKDTAERFRSELMMTVRLLRRRQKQFAKVYLDMLAQRHERGTDDLLADYHSRMQLHRQRLSRLAQAKTKLAAAMAEP